MSAAVVIPDETEEWMEEVGGQVEAYGHKPLQRAKPKARRRQLVVLTIEFSKGCVLITFTIEESMAD